MLFCLNSTHKFYTMKSLSIVMVVLILMSCKNNSDALAKDEYAIKPHGHTSHNKTNNKDTDAHLNRFEEFDKVSVEMEKFEQNLIKLYNESEKRPENVIRKADSLLKTNNKETNIYKLPLKEEIKESLNYLKAELYYKIGQYNSSLAILNNGDYTGCDNALAKAANYTKLKKHDMALSLIDSTNCDIKDYALGNYYETIGDKINAIKVYNKIKNDNKVKHYTYYELTTNRLNELSKSNAKLLDDMYFPTGYPSYEIAN